MDTERKDYYEVSKVQERNQEDLESYKELLKKELDSIKSLVGVETNETSAIGVSHSTLSSSISAEEYQRLKEENRTLKIENESLNSANLILENDNRLLRENLERLQLEISNISELETENARLKEVILNLEKEKLELKKRKIPKIADIEKSYNQELPVDISNEIKSIFESERPAEASSSTPHKGYTVPPIKPKKFRRKLTSKSESMNEEPSKPLSEDSTSSSELDSKKIIKETVRRKCPTCFNTNKKYIRELTDKTNILMQYPRIYGKKYKCGICRTEWK
ncbi:MAG: hypothetical protein ACW972_09285 [Promethearchaeota archaeon]|jgi:hypothetical protein